MASKINVGVIISDHIATLKRHGSNHLSLVDMLRFLMPPVIVGTASYYFCVSVRDSLANILATALSIFAALLFNLLVLVYDLLKKEELAPPSPHRNVRRDILDEIAKNISFNILVALTVIVLLILCLLLPTHPRVLVYLSALVFSLVTLFLLTLLMILKRIHNILVTTFA